MARASKGSEGASDQGVAGCRGHRQKGDDQKACVAHLYLPALTAESVHRRLGARTYGHRKTWSGDDGVPRFACGLSQPT